MRTRNLSNYFKYKNLMALLVILKIFDQNLSEKLNNYWIIKIYLNWIRNLEILKNKLELNIAGWKAEFQKSLELVRWNCKKLKNMKIKRRKSQRENEIWSEAVNWCVYRKCWNKTGDSRFHLYYVLKTFVKIDSG